MTTTTSDHLQPNLQPHLQPHAPLQPRRQLDLRHAQPADEAFLKELYAATRDDLRAAAADPAMFSLLVDMQWRAQMAGYRQAFPYADNLIVEAAGVPLGRLLLQHGMQRWRIVDLALLPAARGHGHASTLLRTLQAEAARAGAALALSVRRDNQPALRLYARLGFTVAQAGELDEEMIWMHG